MTEEEEEEEERRRGRVDDAVIADVDADAAAGAVNARGGATGAIKWLKDAREGEGEGGGKGGDKGEAGVEG